MGIAVASDPGTVSSARRRRVRRPGEGMRQLEQKVKRVVDWLRSEARVERGRAARGGSAQRVDGCPEEAGLRRATLRARARVIREALVCVRTISEARPQAPAPEGAVELAVFLQDRHDDLVVEVLHALAAWHTVEALPAVLELLRRVPAEAACRPRVVRAVRECIHALTGEAITTPDRLRAWMDARRHVAARDARAARRSGSGRRRTGARRYSWYLKETFTFAR